MRAGSAQLVTGFPRKGTLTATTQTVAWSVIFFVALAGASAVYVTVSEIFLMETRAMAIAFFFAFVTAVGGIGGPILFGALIGSGKAGNIFIDYVIRAALMIAAGVVQLTMGVEAAGRELEDIAPPLTAQGEELEEPGEAADRLTAERREVGTAPEGRTATPVEKEVGR